MRFSILCCLLVVSLGCNSTSTNDTLSDGTANGGGTAGGGSGGTIAKSGGSGMTTGGTMGGTAGFQGGQGGTTANSTGGGGGTGGGTAGGQGGAMPKGGASGAAGSSAFNTAAFLDVIRFDFSGENGVPYGTGKPPFAASLGYPAGVPNGYNWKFATNGTSDLAGPLNGRGTQTAGAAYDQIYQRRPGDAAAPNARVLLEPIQTYYFSKSKNMWIKVEQQTIGGAAFAEDFVNNQATGADARDEANGAISVRSGSNAAGDAGGVTGRTTDDGPVGYNFHGFDKRFMIDWADAKAVLVTEVMSCIPHNAANASDCAKNPYLGNVGLDSWAATTSNFDGFKTHGGVGGGRFKPVTEQRQLFTNYNGPLNLLDTNPPPIPEGF